MVKSKSTSRLSSINESVILTQTDTTVGFISQNKRKLYEIKSRKNTKPFITVYSSFKEFCKSNRVPKNTKALMRRSKKTTFIVKDRAFRIAKNSLNSHVIRELKYNYSTSANQSGKNFDREFCEDKADIIVEDKNGLYESSSSALIKINSVKKVRIR